MKHTLEICVVLRILPLAILLLRFCMGHAQGIFDAKGRYQARVENHRFFDYAGRLLGYEQDGRTFDRAGQPLGVPRDSLPSVQALFTRLPLPCPHSFQIRHLGFIIRS